MNYWDKHGNVLQQYRVLHPTISEEDWKEMYKKRKIEYLQEDLNQRICALEDSLESPTSDFMKMKMWFLEHHPDVLD